MIATLDIISSGRLEAGIGAGWNEAESGAYGIELGTLAERSDRFEEACEVLVGLNAHCADIGRDPSEITLSSHVRFDPAAGAS